MSRHEISLIKISHKVWQQCFKCEACEGVSKIGKTTRFFYSTHQLKILKKIINLYLRINFHFTFHTYIDFKQNTNVIK